MWSSWPQVSRSSERWSKTEHSGRAGRKGCPSGLAERTGRGGWLRGHFGFYNPPMRLGLLGPCGGHERELETAARGLRERLGAERVVYLGADRALDLVVGRWAVDLV